MRRQPGVNRHGLPMRTRRGQLLLVACTAVLAVLMTLLVTGWWHARQRPVPAFASLAANPDMNLHGTVAYFSAGSGCVRIIAASGAASRDVLCLSKQDVAVRPDEGVKPAGPQLVWRADGRLDVTMFRWRAASGPPVYEAGWQKLIDARTGQVSEITAGVPTVPVSEGGPTLTPDGRRVSFTFDPATGRATVLLSSDAGSRTLLSVHGPGEYTYRFGPVFWAPNWQWIAASDDDRILIITPGPPAQTRVLATGTSEGAGGGTAGPAFAVSSADLLDGAG
ncbi:MAG TPA: hypothetical protein VHO01_01630 [Jatrophihabitans sp.]|nr:hypothetical protein [Jatrophihabitans sp.]